MTCGIYKIENKINGKCYIGQSIDIKRRWKDHKVAAYGCSEGYNYPLYRAIRKYGKDNFKFEIIENCLPKDLDEKEKYYIKKYNTVIPNGYNITYGGNQGLKYDYEVIYNKWQEGYLCKELEEIFNCEDCVIHNALLAYGVTQEDIYKRRVENKTIALIAFDRETKEPLKLFYSVYAAKNFFNTNHNSDFIEAAKNPFVRTCYGYYWDFAKEDNLPIKEFSDEDFWSHQKLNTTNIYERTPEFKEKMSLRNRIVERPSRENLKKLIRNISFLQIGRNFNVSDNAIRKWCKFYNLPTRKKDIKALSDKEWELI